MEIIELYKAVAQQQKHNAWIVATIAHYEAKILVYQVMIKEWEDELAVIENSNQGCDHG